MTKWVEGKVISQKHWTTDLCSLFIKAPILPFVAGQFTQICLDPSFKHFRPYSLVNAPGEETLEFYYSLVQQGYLTTHLSKLMVGDPLWVAQKPAGKFVLSEMPNAQTLWLFATGTGLGVFLSMLKTKEPWERFQHVVLVHSVRLEKELTHQDLIQEWLAQRSTQFQWVPIVTRESVMVTQSIRMTQLLSSGKLEALTHLDLSHTTSQVMLCGNPAMVFDVSQLLFARGLKINRPHQSGQITVENYWKL